MTDDPFTDRLSAYLDGELADDERVRLEEHLATCATCREVRDDLTRIVREARALGDRPPDPPEDDLWPGIAAALDARGSTRRALPPPALAAAAVVLLALGAALGAWLANGSDPAPDVATAFAGEPFLLVLHQAPGTLAGATPEEEDAIREEYAAWAREGATAGWLADGAELGAEPGFLVRHDGGSEATPSVVEAGGIAGYFVIHADDYDEALRIAGGCPHLAHGWIEVRRIET